MRRSRAPSSRLFPGVIKYHYGNSHDSIKTWSTCTASDLCTSPNTFGSLTIAATNLRKRGKYVYSLQLHQRPPHLPKMDYQRPHRDSNYPIHFILDSGHPLVSTHICSTRMTSL